MPSNLSTAKDFQKHLANLSSVQKGKEHPNYASNGSWNNSTNQILNMMGENSSEAQSRQLVDDEDETESKLTTHILQNGNDLPHMNPHVNYANFQKDRLFEFSKSRLST